MRALSSPLQPSPQPPSAAVWRSAAPRHRGLAALALVLLPAAGLLLSHCFTPTYSDCAYRCASDEPRCPPGYECRPDNFCHLPDSTNLCLFGIDLAGLSLDGGTRPDLQ